MQVAMYCHAQYTIILTNYKIWHTFYQFCTDATMCRWAQMNSATLIIMWSLTIMLYSAAGMHLQMSTEYCCLLFEDNISANRSNNAVRCDVSKCWNTKQL